MSSFADRLTAALRAKGNPVCVGLDPRFDELPSPMRRLALRTYGNSTRAVASAFVEFNRAIIDAVCDLVPVCKPQIAFYEEYGAEGIRAFEETVRHARHKGLVVISDAKRADIGSTAEAYARAQLGCDHDGIIGHGFGADAVTANPYLGRDALAPFLVLCRARRRGVFVLVRTSNPGARDLQDLETSGRPVYERVAEMVRELGGPPGPSGFNDVGAVVGATYPAEARRLREIMPHTFFLVPGYGAQGATAADAVAGFRADGMGAVVSSSRGAIFAYREAPYADTFGEQRFADAARAAVEDMAAALKAALASR
jgi:orotidine-5'-phosphate decarboxylase